MDGLDFGEGATTTLNNGGSANGDVSDITGNNAKPDGNDITNADNQHQGNQDNPNNGGGDNPNSDGNPSNGEHQDNPSTGELEPGTSIEFDGNTYTVAENGDIVDAEGKVFKQASEVKAWLEETEQTDDNSIDGIDVNGIIDAVGIEVNDENGNPMEFTNDKDGIKAYMDAVIALKTNEANEGALNKFFMNNPLVKEFVDYVTVNNGSAAGFGQIPNRNGITVDKENENQQIQIIKTAASEFGNKGVTDAYIKYLKESGGLYDEACSQLQALIEKDNAFRSQIQQEAERKRQAEQAAVVAYWNEVDNVIKSRNIAGYKIPETWIKEVNGQKVTCTPEDFYDYLYKATEVDADGNKISGYQRDLNKLTDKEVLGKDLLDAWLMFTGGSIEDLVKMAIKEDNVKKLVLHSKQRRAARSAIKITPKNNGGDSNSVILE